MVFGTKLEKASSLKSQDKRRISLLNSDFKMLEDLDAGRFRKVSPNVYLLSSMLEVLIEEFNMVFPELGMQSMLLVSQS